MKTLKNWALQLLSCASLTLSAALMTICVILGLFVLPCGVVSYERYCIKVQELINLISTEKVKQTLG